MSPDEPQPPRLEPLGPGPVTLAGVLGLVGGWSLRRVAAAVDWTTPFVTWSQPLALVLVAAALAGTAWLTTRSLADPASRPEPHRMVNRLVLARASILAGALVAGGYAGYALTWLGDSSELAGERGWRSFAAAVAALGVLAAGAWLERACRVPPGPEDP